MSESKPAATSAPAQIISRLIYALLRIARPTYWYTRIETAPITASIAGMEQPDRWSLGLAAPSKPIKPCFMMSPLSVALKDDADNVRYDAASGRFWIGYGDGGLAEINPKSGRQVASVKLDAHPESFQLENNGKRIFVNVPNAGHIAVIDREKGAVIEKIPLKEASANFPMALDEADHRIFIGCRKPAKLLVLDTETSKTVTTVDIVGDTDDLFYDAANKRIYVSGGEGSVTVISQTNADSYNVAGQVTTAPGARTSFLVRETGMLYVAVPHRGQQKAEVRVFTSHL